MREPLFVSKTSARIVAPLDCLQAIELSSHQVITRWAWGIETLALDHCQVVIPLLSLSLFECIGFHGLS